MLKPLVCKFPPDLSARLKDIAEKPVPAKLKQIIARSQERNKRGAMDANAPARLSGTPRGPLTLLC